MATGMPRVVGLKGLNEYERRLVARYADNLRRAAIQRVAQEPLMVEIDEAIERRMAARYSRVGSGIGG